MPAAGLSPYACPRVRSGLVRRAGAGLGQVRADGAQAREVVDVARQGGHLGDRYLGVPGREAVAGALLAGEQPHAFGVQAEQARRQLLDRNRNFLVCILLLLCPGRRVRADAVLVGGEPGPEEVARSVAASGAELPTSPAFPGG